MHVAIGLVSTNAFMWGFVYIHFLLDPYGYHCYNYCTYMRNEFYRKHISR